ncbi:MAG: hypothetical protein ACJAVN_002415 [Roseivirga sp.]|jgi:hypothetical protein
MRRRIKIFGLLGMMLMGIVSLSAQKVSDEGQTKSKRTIRVEERKAKEDRKIKFNSKELALLMAQRDLVIKDDGIGSMRSGLKNFFRIKGDTLTFQKTFRGKNLYSNGELKSKGLITKVNVMEYLDGVPRRIQITYTDMATFDPNYVLIFVHANRIEVKRDMFSAFIRGKLTTNEDANVLEVWPNRISGR